MIQINKHKRLLFSLAVSGAFLVGLLLLLNVLNGVPQVARAAPGVLFVKPDGSGTACSQSAPCDLQTALAAAGNGDTIYLAGGIYTGSGDAVLTINAKSVSLYGGWDGSTTTPPVRDPALHPSILDGQESRRVVSLSGPATIVLDGIVITNGKVLSSASIWKGAGLYASDVDLTLRHVEVYSNVLDVYDVSGSTSYGGGAAVEGGSLVVEDSLFRRNGNWAKSASYGGGLAALNALSVTVTRSTFEDNDAWLASGVYLAGNASQRTTAHIHDCLFQGNGWGYSPGSAYGGYAGAMEITYADAYLVNNRFQNNRTSNNYGALWVNWSALEMEGNIISGNRSYRVSGVYLSSLDSLTLTNNIIADNRSTSGPSMPQPAVWIGNSPGNLLHNTIARNPNISSGGSVGDSYGVLVGGNSTVGLTNTILVSHTVGISVAVGSAVTLNGTLWGSGSWANGSNWDGAGTINDAGNISGDPAFVDPDAGDYHLSPGSAAIDAGVNSGVSTDIDGDPRPIGSGHDIGADEFALHVYLPLVMRGHP